VIGLLAAALSGCAASRAMAPLPEVAPAGIEDLRAVLDRQVQGWKVLRALVEVEGRVNGTKQAFRMGLRYDRPDQITLRGLDPFGRTLFDLLGSGDAVAIRLPREQRSFEGSVEDLAASGIVPPEIPVQRLLHLIHQLTHSWIGPTELLAVEQTDRQHLLIGFSVEDGKARITKRFYFGWEPLRLFRVEWFDETGRLQDSVEFDEARPAGGVQWPHRVRYRAGGTEMRLDFEQVRFE
jgi:hypothetical protein